MPVIKSARKKQKQDKRRTAQNASLEKTYKQLLKLAKQTPSQEAMQKAFSALDKAAKNNIIHKNKAARLKASLARNNAKNSKTEKAPMKSPKKKQASKK